MIQRRRGMRSSKEEHAAAGGPTTTPTMTQGRRAPSLRRSLSSSSWRVAGVLVGIVLLISNGVPEVAAEGSIGK